MGVTGIALAPAKSNGPEMLGEASAGFRLVAEVNIDETPLPVLIPEWTRRAVCAKGDPDVLFVTGAAQRDASTLCAGCPVKLECLAEALDGRMEFGVWGGMTERQRRALLKKAPTVVSWRELLEEARNNATREVAS